MGFSRAVVPRVIGLAAVSICVLAAKAAHSQQRYTRLQSVLGSGWDESGRKLSLETHIELNLYLIDGDPSETMVEYTTHPLEKVRTHTHPTIPGGLWLREHLHGKPSWEVQTFLAFLTYVPTHSYYVDFGTWIGPTLFYAAQLVDKSFGVEADPVAFASVSTTLKLNQDKPWGKKATIQPGGVGPGSDEDLTATRVPMKSASAGNSCSGMGKKVNCGDVTHEWDVFTYSLPALIAHWNIDPSNSFIKVDVEAFECTLVPSWIQWMRKLPTKPTFYISFHSYITRCSDDEYRGVLQFARMFKRTMLFSESSLSEIRLENSFEELEGTAVIFTDRDIM